jgi:hypothetical protein
MRSALRFISYFRAIEEIITQTCAVNLDSRFVLCQYSLHTVVQGKERDTMSSAEDQARKTALLNAEDVEDGASRTFAHEPGEGEAW